MPLLTDRDKKRVGTALEKAAVDASFKMQVRHGFGDRLEFSDFAKDFGANVATNLAIDLMMSSLKRQGVDLSLHGGGSGMLPDRYTLIIDGKRIYGAVSWDF